MDTSSSTSAASVTGLLALADTYFDAAYAMDADKFESIFHKASTVTRMGEGGAVVATPIAD